MNNTVNQPVIITIQKGGPAIIMGEVHLTDHNGLEYPTTSFTLLCRCGESKDLPYCDNAHLSSNFDK
jgi:CDGSH-type Zn-finger protein